MIKNPPANTGGTGDLALIPGLGRATGGGNGNPLQNSCMENPMDRAAWPATVHGAFKELDMAEWLKSNRVYVLIKNS